MLDTNTSFKQRADNFSEYARLRISNCNRGYQIAPGTWIFDCMYAGEPTKEMATKAQRASAGLLYRFLHDTGRV